MTMTYEQTLEGIIQDQRYAMNKLAGMFTTARSQVDVAQAERDELSEALDVALDRERETADLAVKYEAERGALAAQLAAARALLLEDWEHSRFDAALYPDGSLRPFATQWTRDLYAFLWPEGKKP